jgi:hypothetical protein
MAKRSVFRGLTAELRFALLQQIRFRREQKDSWKRIAASLDCALGSVYNWYHYNTSPDFRERWKRHQANRKCNRQRRAI